MTPPGRIAIVEDDPDGHRLALVEILIRHVLEKTGQKPWLVTSQRVLDSKPYGIYLRPLEGSFELRVYASRRSGSLFVRWRKFMSALSGLRGLDVEQVLVPTADRLDSAVGLGGWLGFRLWGFKARFGILRLDAAYPKLPFAKKLAAEIRFGLQRWGPFTAFYHDDYAVEEMRRARGIHLRAVPDPMLTLDLKPTPQPRRGPGEKRIFGVTGVLDRRKGVDLLVEAFAKADLPREACLLLAGEAVHGDLVRRIEQLRALLGGDRILFQNEYLSAEDYKAQLARIDVVCLPYRGHVGPSNVFQQAAFLNKVVIASDYGCLGWAAGKYAKAVLFKDGSVESLVSVLRSTWENWDALLAVEAPYRPSEPAEYARVFCGF
ncbi:MAG TPA: glycosyltransferase [bacterium]|nr:glycosyltransferase [bacterium]